MDLIVHSTIDEEHDSLKLGGADERTFSVRFSLSLEESQNPGDNEVNDGEVEESTCEKYAKFVDDVGKLNKKVNFRIYKLSAEQSPAQVKDEDYGVLPGAHDGDAGRGGDANGNVDGLKGEFKSWLSTRLDKLGNEGVVSPLTGQHEVAEDELTGFHVLMGAASWPAPIPQQLGLVKIITISGLEENDRVAIIPLIDDVEVQGLPAKADIERLDHDEIIATWVYGGAGVYSACRASFSSKRKDVSNTLLDKSGFIKKEPSDGKFAEIVRRIEKSAGGLFTGFVAASQIEWPHGPSEETNTDSGQSWLVSGEARFFLGCLAWQAATMVGTAFDTLLVALHMPGRSGREGQLLAPFLDILVRDGLGVLTPEENGDSPPLPLLKGISSAERRAEFRHATRKGLRNAINDLAGKTGSKWDLLNAEPSTSSNADDGLPENIKELWHLAGLEHTDTQLTLALIWYAASDWRDATEAFNKLKEHIAQLISMESGETEREYLTGRLATELAALHDGLLSEDGIERVLVELLKHDKVRDQLTGIWWQGIPVDGKEVLVFPDNDSRRQSSEGAFKERIGAFRDLLTQGFNGAEAARQSVGSLIGDLAAHRSGNCPSLLDDLVPGMRRKINLGDDSVSKKKEHLENKKAIRRFWHDRLLEGKFNYKQMEAHGNDGNGNDQNDRLFIHLPRPLSKLAGEHAGEAERAIRQAARAAAKDAYGALLATNETRFVPDSAPEPILVPIALDSHIDDDEGIDQFTANFSGLSLLVKKDDGQWAHACLAEFSPPDDTEQHGQRWMGLPVTLAPLPSAVVDNRRELFISYSGLPFSSNAYSDAMPEGDGGNVVPGFYQLDYPNKLEDQKNVVFCRLPPLAYGSTYRFAAHVVGRSGLLPQAVRLDENSPWLPKGKLDSEKVLDALKVPVSRKTAIGSVAIREAGSRTGRIGCWPKDVLPLSADYPRVSVEPEIRTDLLRNRDGTGMIPLPEVGGEPSVVVLRDMEVWAGADGDCNLTLRVGTNATDDANGVVFSIPLKPEKRHEIKITLQHTGGQVSVVVSGVKGARTLNVGQRVKAAWLSLEVDENCISLADPRPEVSGKESAGRSLPENLLLLGGKTSGVDMPWKEPFSKEVDLEISLPRMSFADFMRWTNNPDLVERALEISGADPEGRKAIFHNFRVLLVSLDIDRFNNPEAAQWLESLPDLAVHSVEISAIPLDSLASKPGRVRDNGAQARTNSVAVEMPSLWDLFRSAGLDQTLKTEDLSKVDGVLELEKINKALCETLSVASQDVDQGGHLELVSTNTGKLKLTIPSGTTARLSARPLVDKGHFERGANDRPPILDKRLRQHAIGDRPTNLCIFDGAGLTIESMIGPLAWRSGLTERPWLLRREQWAEVRDGVLVHHHVAGRPSYALAVKADPDEHWQWRQVGRVTTRTQAWRFTGRPIYSWIDPKAYCDGAVGEKQASFRMKPAKGGKQDDFFSFEKEIFLGRDDDDAQPRTVTLQPMGRETRLVEMHADETKGATFHRHALELHSRYAGAMKHPERDGFCEAWTELPRGSTERTQNADRWVRVAVLAKRPTGELTRPQLRALMPLTRRPDQGWDRHTVAPPVLALLQEEPLAFGGLATRIASEIRTGIGYQAFGYTATTDRTDANAADGQRAGASRSTIVLPGDARKEIGPDPRLSYRAMAKDVARSAMLPAEGPIGLTFDRDATASAGFANTALVLHPELASGKQYEGIEENFISVSLRRYLDPAWLIPDESQSSAVGDNGELPLDKGALWIPVDGTFSLSFEKDPKFEGLRPDEPIDDAFGIEGSKVHVNRLAIDSTDFPAETKPANPVPEKLLHLCDLPSGSRSLLVIPQDKGRLSVSVMAENKVGRRYGAGNTPVVLASVELRIGNGLRPIVSDKQIRPSLSTASATTALNWVRTNADFDKVSVHASGSGDGVMEDRVSASELYASIKCDKKNKIDEVSLYKLSPESDTSPLWVRAGQSIRRTPTHVQRHMVALFSKTLTGIGREIDQPCVAHLLHGKVPVCKSDTDDDKLKDVDKLRLIEIETTAEIVGWSANSGLLPARYRNAYFDLSTIGHSAIKPGGAIMLRFRHVGSSKQLKKGTKITLLFSDPTMEPCVVEVPEGSVEIVLFMRDGSPIEKNFILVDGSVIEQKDSPAIRLTMQTIGLSIESVISDEEVWFEVSMLAGRMKHSSDFNFDWLFGAPRSGDMTDALTPKHLAERTEAQARIVSVSPVIPVQKINR